MAQKHDPEQEWKLALIVLAAVTVSIGSVGLVVIYTSMG